MFEQILSETKVLRAYLAGVRRKGESIQDAEDHLDELRFLTETMGAEISGWEMANVFEPNPKYLFGSGKAEEIKSSAEMRDATVIIVDDELTPAQQRNWEKLTKLAVIDRREVILDIFAQRARTKEARLQVELARLEYSLPRLKRAWTHLERQRGGGGFIGGAGEAQIEVDRRIVRDNIAKVKRELERVRRQRATQRKSRLRKPVPTAALVGYTNAGKSSILNALTGSGVLAEDKLFATLDPTTRRLELPGNREILVSDTVGFIRKLPHTLVEAFMATLEEARLADLLVHVLDASHPNVMEHLQASNAVLKELGALENPTIYLLNKADRLEDYTALAALKHAAEPHLVTSAVDGTGLEELAQYLADHVAGAQQRLTLRIPPDRYDIVGLLHREGHILDSRFEDSDSLLEVDLPAKHHKQVEQFVVTNGHYAPAREE